MHPAEHYILNQRFPYKTILLQLQSVIKSVVPQAELFYKWKIPFYYYQDKPLCFLNQSKNYVDFGFWHHEQMDQYTEFFVSTNRKTVRSLRYQSIEDINDEILIYVLQRLVKINKDPFKMMHGRR